MISKPFAFLVSMLVSASSLQASPTFPAFEGRITVPAGNHGATSVEVWDQRFLKTTDAYGPRREELTFDLETGRIEATTVEFTPNESAKTILHLPADQGGSYLPWRKQLVAMIGDLAAILDNEKIRKPEIQAVRSYLQDQLVAADSKAPDAVALNPLPRDLRRGTTQTFSVEYFAREDRDLRLDLFDADWCYLEGTRVPVKAGYQTVNVTLTIPMKAPLNKPGHIAVKLIPVNGTWSDKRAEDRQAASFKKNRVITSTSASFMNFGSPRVAVYTNYYCPESCDIRVDIFNAAGQWVTSEVAPAEAPLTPNAEQFTRVFVNASLLSAAEDYTYFVKLLPQGGSWDQYYDESPGRFKAGE